MRGQNFWQISVIMLERFDLDDQIWHDNTGGEKQSQPRPDP